jgi:Polyketide cyclase / dehydrase and lipid transport
LGKASDSIHVATSLAEAWELYFDPVRWASWVDGFGRVEAENGYPELGGTLRWRSVPAGRGTVTEQVLDHDPRHRHRIAFSDPQSSGELLTEMAIESDGVRVTLKLDYRLAQRGPFAWLADRIFVRGQMRRSLARTLARFKREAEDRAGR